jgi:hypothetical protein
MTMIDGRPDDAMRPDRAELPHALRRARRDRLTAALLVGAFVLAGCTGGGDADGAVINAGDLLGDSPTESDGAAVDGSDPAATGGDTAGDLDEPTRTPVTGATAGVPDNQVTAPQGQHPSESATHDTDPDAEDSPSEPIGLTAAVHPMCVQQGETMKLTVQTQSGLPVIYTAVYDGEEGGGAPPFGSGHGGNDGGDADEAGVYESEWTVSPTAPVGPGRVDVLTARRDGSGQTEQISVMFEVRAAASVGC